MQAATNTPPEKQEERLTVIRHLELKAVLPTNLNGIMAKTTVAQNIPTKMIDFSTSGPIFCKERKNSSKCLENILKVNKVEEGVLTENSLKRLVNFFKCKQRQN